MVIVGWYFARKENNFREDRHELRNLLDGIKGQINDLENKAYEFYIVDAGEDTIKSRVDIQAGYDGLRASIQRLENFNERFHHQPRLFEFRDALIGGNFEEIIRQRCRADDDKLKKVSWAARELVKGLEAEYDHIYLGGANKRMAQDQFPAPTNTIHGVGTSDTSQGGALHTSVAAGIPSVAKVRVMRAVMAHLSDPRNNSRWSDPATQADLVNAFDDVLELVGEPLKQEWLRTRQADATVATHPEISR